MVSHHHDSVQSWLDQLAAATSARSGAAAATAMVELFEDEGYWRDLLAFTWNLTTAEGAGEIARMIEKTWPRCILQNLRIDGDVVDEGKGVLRAGRKASSTSAAEESPAQTVQLNQVLDESAVLSPAEGLGAGARHRALQLSAVAEKIEPRDN